MKADIVKEYIVAQQIRDITECLKILMCSKHKWEKSGLGYKCSNCDYYTGTNSELNDKIRKIK